MWGSLKNSTLFDWTSTLYCVEAIEVIEDEPLISFFTRILVEMVNFVWFFGLLSVFG